MYIFPRYTSCALYDSVLDEIEFRCTWGVLANGRTCEAPYGDASEMNPMEKRVLKAVLRHMFNNHDNVEHHAMISYVWVSAR